MALLNKAQATTAKSMPKGINGCQERISIPNRIDLIKTSLMAIGGMEKMQIPDMPDVILKLERELKSKFPNTVRVIEIIESNAVIAGEILATVKSPAFMRHVKRYIEVKTIENAVNFIGLKQTYRLAMAAAVKNIPNQTTLFRSIIDHSSDVATACAEIAGYVHGVDIEDAYLFGLFRDCGAIGMSVALNNEYDPHWDRMKTFPVSGVEAEIDTLGSRHDYLGVIVARKWGFGHTEGDHEIMYAIQEHHNYAQVRCFSNEKIRLLVAIGLLAEILVNEINAEAYIAHESGIIKEAAIDTLCLSDEVLTLIRRNLISTCVG